MTEASAARHVFPGSNTPRGFYSYYRHILPQEQARRIFVIKGGPGVGKSSFMKRLGEAMEQEGIAVEYHHCSADNDSLDAVVLPEAGVAVLDGTAPHVVDPINPGAVDEIVNFGEFWDEAGIRSHRNEIIETNERISGCFDRSFRYLAAARSVYDDIEAVNRRLIDHGALNQMADSLVDELIGGQMTAARAGRTRRLFGGAITPNGACNYLETVVGPMAYKVVVQGQPGTGKSTLIEKIAARAVERGLDVEAFHCPFDPERTEHLVIRGLRLGITTSVRPHVWSGNADLEVNTDEALDESGQAKDSAMIAQAQETYRHLFDYAVAALREAKQEHDKLEAYYVPHMNFSRIDEFFNDFRVRVLDYVRETAPVA